MVFSALQGSYLYYFKHLVSKQAAGVIPLEYAKIEAAQSTQPRQHVFKLWISQAFTNDVKHRRYVLAAESGRTQVHLTSPWYWCTIYGVYVQHGLLNKKVRLTITTCVHIHMYVHGRHRLLAHLHALKKLLPLALQC